ncbi:MAG: redox-sensing transcriptional repressor Rex [Candidatus Sumerlaeia bacterium]|nr:redox-sensing transcriptional repressor Rex [Candidatus Sumerlaeia bacterium]
MEDRPQGQAAEDGAARRIPKAVIKRLSLYSRVLQNLEMKNITKVSSKELSEHLGQNPAQVRKDLAYFGQFGTPGVGYYVAELRAQIKRILRTDREVRAAVVGVGNLGQALLAYTGFAREGFRIPIAFDTDPLKVGRTIGSAQVLPVEELEERIRQYGIEIIILAVPSEPAQAIADRVIRCGITAILNFVPTRLVVPPGVKVHYVDLTIELESLAYYLK